MFYNYYNAKQKFNSNVKTRLKEIVSVASLSIDTEAHSKIQKQKDKNSNNYKRKRQI